MFIFAVCLLVFSSTIENSKCQNSQDQNRYTYPQNMVRQTNPATGQQMNPATGQQMNPATGQQINPATGQQVDANGNPIMPTGVQGQIGGNQIPPQNNMSNQPFPQQNPAVGGPNPQQFPPNQQFPQNQGFSGNQPFPQNQGMPGSMNPQFPQNQVIPGSMNPQFPQNPGGFPTTNPQFSNQGPHYPQGSGHGIQYPEPPRDLHLYPDGVFAYGYIMHTIAAMLNNPTSRNNLFYLFNNLQMVMSDPKSTPIIQEFFNRWSRAIDGPIGQTVGTYPNNVVVQNVPTSSNFFDMLKRKGSALVDLAKDVTIAKTKALNSLFDGSIFSPAVQLGTNWANAGMQAVQGTVTPFIGNTPGTTGQTMTVGTTPVTVTTPQVVVH